MLGLLKLRCQDSLCDEQFSEELTFGGALSESAVLPTSTSLGDNHRA